MSPANPPQPDMGLDQAEGLVVKILDFVAADRSRLAHFLTVMGIRPETVAEAAHSRLLLLSILDAIARDEVLMLALKENEQVSLEEIELARSRLAVRAVAELSERRRDDVTEFAIRARVKQQLIALSQLMRKRTDLRTRRSKPSK
jgi:hypothetical protein